MAISNSEVFKMTRHYTTAELQGLAWGDTRIADLDLTAGDILEMTEHTVAALEEQIERLNALNILQAKETCEYFWTVARREQERQNQFPKMGSRIRVLKNTLTIIWYYSPFALKIGEASKKLWVSKHISKPAGKTRYSNASLSRCHTWEKENIIETENDYEIMRRRQLLITEARSRIKKLKELTASLVPS
jgi:hypothetical protein